MRFAPPVPHTPADPFRPFYVLTGLSFLAFASGFSVCLFDLSQIDACVDYADSAVSVLKNVGDHIIEWSIAFAKEVFERHPVKL
jgi:hypothetical protein